MRHLRDWTCPVPEPLGGDGRWHAGHLWSGRDPACPRYDLPPAGVHPSRPHLGLDIAGIEGSLLLAPDDGVCVEWGYNSGAGYYVTLRHRVRWGHGLLEVFSRQCHCLPDQIIQADDVVLQGEPIAFLGSTGGSASPHDHTTIMLTPTLPSSRSLFLDPEPVYYQGRSEFMQQGHPYPEEVRKVQRRLNSLGYTPALTPDGDYGAKTAAAVKWFQSRVGIEAHGACSELTLALLFAARGKDI